MTDKQIIIDCVDVSGCPYYIDSDGSCSSHDCECIKCVHNACFYKDLKAKEQECQQAMDNYVQLDLQRVKEYNELVDLYKAKEQECEELKKKLDTLSVTRYKLLDDLWVAEENLKDYIEHFNKASDKLDQLKTENEKLEQYLAEIKDIASKVLLNTHDLEQFKDADALFGALLEIHKKISKCEGNDDMENN